MRRNDWRGTIYQVTLRTYGLRPLLKDPARAALFCLVLGSVRRQLGFLLHAYVVLPDRARLIIGTHDAHPQTVGLLVRRLKSRFAREVNSRRGRGGLVWQDSDQTIRLTSRASVLRRVEYLHHNPILAGVARDVREWRWSSYRAWTGEGRTPLSVDLPEGQILPIT